MSSTFVSLCKAGGMVLLKEGPRSFCRKTLDYWRGPRFVTPVDLAYQEWIRRNEPSVQDIEAQAREAENMPYRPLISILTPVWNTDIDLLRAVLDSVCRQSYPNWELCIAEGASRKRRVKPVLRDYAAWDERVRVIFLERNLGIAGNSNAALESARGEYVALLDHDDELAPFALYEIARLLNTRPELDYIYSDEDKIDLEGNRFQPFFKPGWSPDYLLACGYTNHLSVYRKKLVDEIGGFRERCDGSQDYDLVLRSTERSVPDRIGHIPKVLYHWRQVPNSTAGDAHAKDGIVLQQARIALADALARRGVEGRVENGVWPGSYRIIRQIGQLPLVSIIIPTRDKVDYLERCLASLERVTTYDRYEILIVDNDSQEDAAKRFLDQTKHTVLPYPEPFNYSRINNMAACAARGEILVFLNNDIEVITPDWVQRMLEHAVNPEIGAVGAKLLYPDQSIQHAGVVLGMSPDQETGVAGHVFIRFPPGDPGYFGAVDVVRNCSAVTAAAMMIRKEAFDAVGGFDPELAVCYNDVDLCLRLGRLGLRTVYTPYATFIHHESVSRGTSVDRREADFMFARWGGLLRNDPYFSPNLNLTTYDCRIRP